MTINLEARQFASGGAVPQRTVVISTALLCQISRLQAATKFCAASAMELVGSSTDVGLDEAGSVFHILAEEGGRILDEIDLQNRGEA